MIPLPPSLHDLPAGTQLKAGIGHTTILADMDFETYSEAGFVWNPSLGKWGCLPGASKRGLSVVGAARYAEHPSTEVLCLAYDLKDGGGKRQWKPGQPPPYDLFNHVDNMGLIEAWNCAFEYYIWTHVCVLRYGFPPLRAAQLRDAMAKARAYSLPGKLDNAGDVLNIKNKKDKFGKKLIELYCVPKNPATKNKSLRRIVTPINVPECLPENPNDTLGLVSITNKFMEQENLFNHPLYKYNIRDIEAEAELSSLIPDLPPSELEFWLCDQAINYRGIQIDLVSINNCISILEQAQQKYLTELKQLTFDAVKSASEVQKIIKWLQLYGVHVDSLDEKTVTELLKNQSLLPDVKRVLEIRSMLAASSVKKLYAMRNQVCNDGRLRDLFIYHSARTGRAAGTGPQPQNLPNSGPDVWACSCSMHYPPDQNFCPWCGLPKHTGKQVEWNADAVEDALTTINTQSLECVEYIWGDAVNIISSCLRGLFTSAPGHDLLCSDYSAIEAVVLAALSGEQWRLDVFNTHGKIYEMSASKITGIPFEEFENHQLRTGGVRQPDGAIKGGQHHPMRKKIGKVAELASGYQGWVGAWKRFGADKLFNDDEEIKQAVLAWRKASPAIVKMWGGQFNPRTKQPEYYGIEGAAIQAVLYPGKEFSYQNIIYLRYGDALYCRLLSGRYLTYHRPKLITNTQRGGLSLSFEGWNSNALKGPVGWVRTETYGGKLVENIVQATARDILAHALVNLEKLGYPVVLHVHDEIVCEVPEGHGSVEELERIMSTMPNWAAMWPIRATGGWRGKRYRK